MQLPPPIYTLFPYTTLFRSHTWHAPEKDPSASMVKLQASSTNLNCDSSCNFAHGNEERKASMAIRNSLDRKSTRLNSSHANISYAVFCLKKKKTKPVHLVPD